MFIGGVQNKSLQYKFSDLHIANNWRTSMYCINTVYSVKIKIVKNLKNIFRFHQAFKIFSFNCKIFPTNKTWIILFIELTFSPGLLRNYSAVVSTILLQVINPEKRAQSRRLMLKIDAPALSDSYLWLYPAKLTQSSAGDFLHLRLSVLR